MHVCEAQTLGMVWCLSSPSSKLNKEYFGIWGQRHSQRFSRKIFLQYWYRITQGKHEMIIKYNATTGQRQWYFLFQKSNNMQRNRKRKGHIVFRHRLVEQNMNIWVRVEQTKFFLLLSLWQVFFICDWYIVIHCWTTKNHPFFKQKTAAHIRIKGHAERRTTCFS